MTYRNGIKRITGYKLQQIRAQHLRAHPLCVRCLVKKSPRYTPAVELDHIVPLHKGGQDVAQNRQGLCVDCHREKTNEDMGYRKVQRIGIDGYPVDDS